ncbi:DUF3558 domain-containing protein [Nocardia macrotermitis]|uniref:DUF3558 domain-containing protein n=1 Tax=Nocardia macrotermitis TaxID=2585198 RepID=UPI001885C1DC|nr:DUF3558 domain-containing protein [Nocardia macrotermitis]
MSAALTGVAVVGLVTGCTKETTGTPAASPTTTGAGHLDEALWNPCNLVSADALQAAKLDPASKVTGIDVNGAVNTTEKSCAWTSTEGPYQVGVAADRFTLDQVRANTALTVIGDVQVGSRKAVTSEDKQDASDKLTCDVSFPFAQGTFDVYLYWRYSERDKITQSPPCGLALSHAVALEPFLPK